jgi:hypothetical protein
MQQTQLQPSEISPGYIILKHLRERQPDADRSAARHYANCIQKIEPQSRYNHKFSRLTASDVDKLIYALCKITCILLCRLICFTFKWISTLLGD